MLFMSGIDPATKNTKANPNLFFTSVFSSVVKVKAFRTNELRRTGPAGTNHGPDCSRANADAYSGAHELDDVHTSIGLKAGASRHPVNPEKADNHQRYPQHNRWTFAVYHSVSLVDEDKGSLKVLEAKDRFPDSAQSVCG